MLLGCALVPPAVSHVNIGGKFYDLKFTREIPQGRVVVDVMGMRHKKVLIMETKIPKLLRGIDLIGLFE